VLELLKWSKAETRQDAAGGKKQLPAGK